MREIQRVPVSEAIRKKLSAVPHKPGVYLHKDRFGVEGKSVLLTFGLLSPSKGIEYVIEALPAILERFPNLVYIVVGATHPHADAVVTALAL